MLDLRLEAVGHVCQPRARLQRFCRHACQIGLLSSVSHDPSMTSLAASSQPFSETASKRLVSCQGWREEANEDVTNA